MCTERHREGQHGQNQQRPEAANARIDRQEQSACADGRAEQTEHPGGVLALPLGEAGSHARGRGVDRLLDAVGLIIHPVDFSVAGDSYKVKSASKSSAVSAPDRFSTGKGARLSGIREQNQRVVGGMVVVSEVSHGELRPDYRRVSVFIGGFPQLFGTLKVSVTWG